MRLTTWLHFSPDMSATLRNSILALLEKAAFACDTARQDSNPQHTFGICVFAHIDDTLKEDLRSMAQNATVLAICLAPDAISPQAMWSLLETGVADVLLWPNLPTNADQVRSRIARWQEVQALADSDPVKKLLIGESSVWKSFVRSVVGVAAFTQASILVTGETGTGKELIARLVHQLDDRPGKGELVILDCSTLANELSGSEFFGHERGAYTGAAVQRDGAFALADGGVLFLDEVGELSLPLQAQLLRVIQEHKYKRLGSNVWQHTEFRLVCATNRDLEQEVLKGHFRADLFYRIAGWRCRTPTLRERKQDILPLAQHFLASLDRRATGVEFDPAVRQYLLSREYPGNVRELRQVVSRIWYRHTGSGPITIGSVPIEERLGSSSVDQFWPDHDFLHAVRHAVDLGMGLKEISQAAADLAMQVGLEQEDGNVARAAKRLGVTDRALQMRRANRKQLS